MMKLGERIELNLLGCRMLWLTKRTDLGKYQLMVLSWDEVKDVALGWIPWTTGTLSECRKSAREWIDRNDSIISREAVPAEVTEDKPEISIVPKKEIRKRKVYTMAELDQLMMKMFNMFNTDFFGGKLPKVIITFESGFKKGAYGWICNRRTWQTQGKDGITEKYAINISSDYLDRPVYDVMSTLLHEMCHLYALENNIQDTSRAGIYHNKKFKQIAESHGLNVAEGDKIGWSITTLTDETKAYIDRNCPITGFMTTMIKPKEKDSKPKQKQSRRKYICPQCGLQITATKEVSVICGDCFKELLKPVFMELEE